MIICFDFPNWLHYKHSHWKVNTRVPRGLFNGATIRWDYIILYHAVFPISWWSKEKFRRRSVGCKIDYRLIQQCNHQLMQSQHEWSPQRAGCFLIALWRGEIKWLLGCRLVQVALNRKGLYLTLSSILASEKSASKTSHFHRRYTSTLLDSLIQQLLGRKGNCMRAVWK